MFSIQFLNELRAAEIAKIVGYFPRGARVLEIGAGTGRQASEIRRCGFDVEAIEISASNYSQDRLFPVTEYDGRTIPFSDNSFDVVFSSNVLEHVRELSHLHGEIRRVLKPGGTCVHVLPTPAWRLWTILSAFPTAFQHVRALMPRLKPRGRMTRVEARRIGTILVGMFRHLFSPFFPRRHGERGTFVSELWLFRARRWRKNFRENGFEIVGDEPMGLHYTGNLMFGAKRSIAQRAEMAKTFGSACHLFRLRRADTR